MTTKTRFDAASIAARIAENTRLVSANKISWEEFSQRQRAAWDAVSLGELNIIGSACCRRHDAVHAALRAI